MVLYLFMCFLSYATSSTTIYPSCHPLALPAALPIDPRHLSFDQTRRFAGGDGQGTCAPYLYRTWLYEKLAACLVPLLLLLLSAALAQQTQRHGHVEDRKSTRLNSSH